MKSTLTLCFLLLFFTVYTQNAMFFTFNEKYDKVYKELNYLDCDTLFQADKFAPLMARYDGFCARYYFNSFGRLYKIETTKTYASAKDSKEAVDGALEYFEKIKAQMNSTSKSQYKKYKAHRKDNIYEIEITTYADNDIEVKLSGWNKSLHPGDNYEPDYETMRITRREKNTEGEISPSMNVSAK